LRDAIKISCTGWQIDADSLPLQYSFEVYNIDSNTTLSVLQDFQASPHLTSFLPAGSPLWLRVLIRDKWRMLRRIFCHRLSLLFFIACFSLLVVVQVVKLRSC
jgi:hypothetical protein